MGKLKVGCIKTGEFASQISINQKFHYATWLFESGMFTWSAIKAAYSKAAVISSFSRKGKDSNISASVSPAAKWLSKVCTVKRLPLIVGFPLHNPGMAVILFK